VRRERGGAIIIRHASLLNPTGEKMKSMIRAKKYLLMKDFQPLEVKSSGARSGCHEGNRRARTEIQSVYGCLGPKGKQRPSGRRRLIKKQERKRGGTSAAGRQKKKKKRKRKKDMSEFLTSSADRGFASVRRGRQPPKRKRGRCTKNLGGTGVELTQWGEH